MRFLFFSFFLARILLAENMKSLSMRALGLLEQDLDEEMVCLTELTFLLLSQTKNPPFLKKKWFKQKLKKKLDEVQDAYFKSVSKIDITPNKKEGVNQQNIYDFFPALSFSRAFFFLIF